MVSILLFLIYIFGFGYALTFNVRGQGWQILWARLGFGLAAFPVAGLVIHRLGLPVDWRIFLMAALVPIFLGLWRRFKDDPGGQRFSVPSWDRSGWALLGIMAFCLLMYCWGPFNYPWLEDDDPWTHAVGAKFVAQEKTLTTPSGEFQYLNPYPPAYDLLIGILHQTEPSIYWTLKFFNGLFVTLSIWFFYGFVREFSGDRRRALWATLFLAVVPCYLSHFIWALSLIMAMFFPAMYALQKVKTDRRFLLPGSVAVAGIFLTQPTHSVKFVLLVSLWWLAMVIIERRWHKDFLFLLFGGAVMSLLWWGPVGVEMMTGQSRLSLRQDTQIVVLNMDSSELAGQMFNPGGGSATRSYDFMDYFDAPRWNLINNPVGLGPILLLLTVLGVWRVIGALSLEVPPQRRVYALTILFWLIFTFLGMNTQTFHLPIGLFAFRFWMLFAIPACLLSAEQVVGLLDRLGKSSHQKIMALVVIAGVALTSGWPKFDLNTGVWSYGVYWKNEEELAGYVLLRNNLKPGTRVFSFVNNLLVIGHDMEADVWSDRYKKAFHSAFSLPVDDLHLLLKEQGFEYVIMGQQEISQFGREAVINKDREFRGSDGVKFFRGVINGVKIYRIL